MKMKKKVLAAAVAAAFGATGNAHAVNIDSDGLGQVLLMPYYTVQGDNETLISVVNTTDQVKAVKVRFREAMNSQEVLDFNLYLSPQDVWVAVVTDDEGGGAKVKVPPAEKTCTVPEIPAEGQPFSSLEYAGDQDRSRPVDPNDTGPYGMERTREGYIEIIEMGNVDFDADEETDASGNIVKTGLGDAATHVDEFGDYKREDMSAECDRLVEAWTAVLDPNGDPTSDSGFWILDQNDGMTGATGGLGANAAVINVNDGVEYSQTITVLDNFYLSGPMGTLPNHHEPGTSLPALSDASGVSNVFFDQGLEQIVTDSWDVEVDSVSAVLMAEKIVNEYTVNPAVGANTDWVVTFPTKHFYQTDPVCENEDGEPVDWDDPEAIPETCEGDARDPFNALYDADPQQMACEIVVPNYWDRNEAYEEEIPVGSEEGPQFSPYTPDEFEPEVIRWALCYEANVISFINADSDFSVFDSENVRGTFPLAEGYRNGWATIDLSNPVDGVPSNTLESADHIYAGLPVIGFSATRLANAGVGVGAAYASTIPHRYMRSIVQSAD